MRAKYSPSRFIFSLISSRIRLVKLGTLAMSLKRREAVCQFFKRSSSFIFNESQSGSYIRTMHSGATNIKLPLWLVDIKQMFKAIFQLWNDSMAFHLTQWEGCMNAMFCSLWGSIISWYILFFNTSQRKGGGGMTNRTDV